MLTPIDIHYISALLTAASEGEEVEVELGSQVWDAAAKKYRDVDITLTWKLKDETVRVFGGIEVKDHTRPLDVEHVEQLVMKFQDMAAITNRAIVSASGFTLAAVEKAKYHKVELIE